MPELNVIPIVLSRDVKLTIFTKAHGFKADFGDRKYYCLSNYSANRLIGLAKKCLVDQEIRLTDVNGVELTFTFHYTIAKPKLLKK